MHVTNGTESLFESGAGQVLVDHMGASFLIGPNTSGAYLGTAVTSSSANTSTNMSVSWKIGFCGGSRYNETLNEVGSNVL